MNTNIQKLHKNLNMNKQQTNRMNTKIILKTEQGEKEYSITVSPCNDRLWFCLIQNNKLEIFYNIGSERDEWKKDYTLMEKINNGGVGEIYRCRGINGKEYAMKIMVKKNLIYNKKMLVQARNEVAILQKLTHPNIIQYIDGWETSEKIIIVQELGGKDLFEKITGNSNGFLSEDEARTIFKQIVSALDYIHKKFIVHRDIKPENIICVDGIPKIIDFGLAKVLPPRLSKTGTRCGTIDYIAPEIANIGKLYDFSVDIWSVGTLLYTMLCGRFPFQGDTLNQISTNIQKGDYNIDFYPWDTISNEAKDLIKRIFTIESEKRIKAQEILEHPWLINYISTEKTRFKKVKKLTVNITSSPNTFNQPQKPPTPRKKKDDLWGAKAPQRFYKLPGIRKQYPF